MGAIGVFLGRCPFRHVISAVSSPLSQTFNCLPLASMVMWFHSPGFLVTCLAGSRH
jgi:hypothetical protein